jgi:peptide chain release factor 2
MKVISDLNDEIQAWEKLDTTAQSIHDLVVLDDESLRPELEKEIQVLEKQIDTLEFDTLLSGPYDKGNALLSINAGAGGTDAQDWAAMLERMYLRWAEKSGFKSEIIHLTEGEEAGIKSVTISIAENSLWLSTR